MSSSDDSSDFWSVSSDSDSAISDSITSTDVDLSTSTDADLSTSTDSDLSTNIDTDLSTSNSDDDSDESLEDIRTDSDNSESDIDTNSSTDSETDCGLQYSINSVTDLVTLLFQTEGIKRSCRTFSNYYSRILKNCIIHFIDGSSKEYDCIKKYAESTHGPTHNFAIKVRNIFSVHRTQECQDYARIKHIGNRKLLWHGTKIQNFSSILQNGLLTRPPSDVDRTGKMFGDGIYFADVVTKAAQYCNDGISSSGILILAEIALGKPYYLTKGENVYNLPNGTNSVKGEGKFQPTSAMKSEHCAEIPLGPLRYSCSLKTDLKYNEYIIYNENQIHLRYLVVFDT